MVSQILLVGCGKMGGAILRGLTKADAFEVTVVDPSPVAGATHYYASLSDMRVYPAFDMVILAIKPQSFGDVLPVLKAKIDATTPVLSIAAGKTVATIAAAFHDDQPVIRTMPNLPAEIGAGVTVAVAGEHITLAHKTLADAVLVSIGDVHWVDDEALMNAVTALSGSGPAYVFLLMEAMAKAGDRAGLPHDLSVALARQTVIGAALLAQYHGDVGADVLRANVTSKGGTTAAALDVLMAPPGIQDLFDRALLAARDRAAALNS